MAERCFGCTRGTKGSNKALTEEIVLDSSVIVSAFVQGDRFRNQARRVMKKVFDGEYSMIESSIVPVEVCGSISRRAGVKPASLAQRQLLRWEEIGVMRFAELTRKRKNEAVDLAIELQIRGMDAIILQVAKENSCGLATFDEEMASKVRKLVKVFIQEDFGA